MLILSILSLIFIFAALACFEMALHKAKQEIEELTNEIIALKYQLWLLTDTKSAEPVNDIAQEDHK